MGRLFVVCLVALFVSTAVYAETEVQRSWYLGPGVKGPVTEWGESFWMSDSIVYSVEGQISLLAASVDHNAWTKYVIDTDSRIDGHATILPADIDNDGYVDLVAILDNYPGMVVWYEYTSSGYVRHDAAQINSGRQGTTWPYDMDGDGDIDIVASASEGLVWLENDGGGTFNKKAIDLSKGYQYARPGDVDNDGDIDILVHDLSQDYMHGDLWLFRNDGTMSFTSEMVFDTNRDLIWRINVGDLDGDGYLDIQTAGEPIMVFLNDGTGSFSLEYTFNGLVMIDGAWISDFDADGDQDIMGAHFGAASYYPRDLFWLENDGSGMAFTHHSIGGPNGDYGDGGMATDVDLDGRMDALGAYRRVAWFEQLSGGGYAEHPLPNGNVVNSHWIYGENLDGGPCVGDVDVDILVSRYTQFLWWENNMVTFHRQGMLVSSILDAQTLALWHTFGWDDCEPDGCNNEYYVRSGRTVAELESSPWLGPITSPGDSLEDYGIEEGRYFQYRLVMENLTGEDDISPSIHEVEVTYQPLVLDIVEESLDPSYCPPTPVWMSSDTVDVLFHTTVAGDHEDVYFESTDLVHSLKTEHKIAGSAIEFVPEMFEMIADGETVDVEARIPIRLGALAGNYEGMFTATSLQYGDADTVLVVLEVGAYPDMDIDDNEGNLADNTMDLLGLPGDTVGGTFVMLNPNAHEYNVDAFDGPGNVDLPVGTVTLTDLITIDKLDTIPGSEISLYDVNDPGEDPVRAILSGTARHIGLELAISETANYGTYKSDVIISFNVSSCVDDSIVTVSDSFGIRLKLGEQAGEFAFMEGDTLHTPSYTPPDQWVQDGMVEVQFTLGATGDVYNIHLYSEDLVHEALPIEISGNSVNFSPGEIDVIPSGETREITARIPVPIGRRNGAYVGAFNAVADGGATANTVVILEVNPVGDLDVQDFAGNLSANTMVLTGIAGGVVLGRYTVENPNLPENNVDLYDGPANDDLTEITVVATDLSLDRGGAQEKCKGVQLLCVQYNAGGGAQGKCKGVRKISFQYHNSGRGHLANVRLTSKKTTYFMGSVSDGDIITADASPGKLGTNLDILVYDRLDKRVHTSCSKPIEIGMVFGDWEIVDLDKITEGGGEAPSPAFIEIKSKGVTYFAGMVEDGDTICADARPEKLGTNTEFYIEGYLNTEIHTSCSKPIEIGMVFGNFEIVDLIKIEESGKGVSISSDNVDGNVNGVTSIISGAGEDLLLQITIPAKGIKHYDPEEDRTYKGTVTVQGKAVNANVFVSDDFRLELRIVKGKARDLTSGFWGEPGGSGNLLRWTGFGLNETGYAVYRALNGSYVKLADLSSTSRSFLDGETRSSLIYEYKLGLKIGGSEIMIGPILIKTFHGRSYLSRSFPNPTSGAAMFRFGVAAESHVSVSMYNVTGQMVKVMLNEKKLPGTYTINWDSSEFASGVYFCRINVGPTDGQGKPYSASRKVVVLR